MFVISVVCINYAGDMRAATIVRASQPKMLDIVSMPYLRVIPPARVCAAEEIDKQVARFVPGESSCPSGEWWPALRLGGLRCRDLIFMQIGANKGYKLASWISLFAPDMGVYPNKLSAEYDDLFARFPITWFENAGGTCEDHREGPAPPRAKDEPVCPGASEVVYSGERRFTVHAFEPLPGNANVLRGALQSLIMKGAPQSRFPVDYQLHEVAVTGDPSLTRIEFGSCNSGNERCGVRSSAQGPDDGDVYSKGRFVEATTVDKWLLEENIETVDVLTIDTEGHDPAVLRGADALLARGGAQVLEFEVHYLRDWNVTSLEGIIQRLDAYGYDCFFEQRLATLLRLTGCWHPKFEIKHWSNVICALRASGLVSVLESFTPHHTVVEAAEAETTGKLAPPAASL